MRLHLLGAPDGTIRAVILASADDKERDVARRLFAIGLRGGETIVCDKGYAGAEFARTRPALPRAVLAPRARPNPPTACTSRASATHRVDLLDAQRPPRTRTPPARTLHGLRARIATKLLAYSAGIWLNWLLGRPSRTFADLTA
jgi:hypothetical protein